MITIPYYTSEDSVNLTRPLPDHYYGWSPLELEDEKARYTVALFSARDGNRASNATFLEHELDLIDQEIDRQRAILARNANDPRAVNWPDHRLKYQKLIDIAQNLKRDYRLHVYVQSSIPSTNLTRAGLHRWRGHCPIPTHPGEGVEKDAHPSFVVFEDDLDDQHFHCFACGAHGDIFELVNQVYGYLRFEGRVRIVAEAFGCEVDL